MPLEVMQEKVKFIRNILLNNILPMDIFLKSTELKLTHLNPHCVMIIHHAGQNCDEIVQILENLYPDKNADFVIDISEDHVALVKEISHEISTEEIATEIEKMIGSELLIPVKLGIGTIVHTLAEILTSYKEAQIALEIGRVFAREKSVFSFEKLGLGCLIYQISPELCHKFLEGIVSVELLDEIEKEFYNTISCFFENSLNISETARKLFVHRNTLVYRLEKIKKMTGLDIRDFEQAIIFKMALMVRERIIYG